MRQIKKTKLNRNIAYNIVQAKIASDAGKHINIIHTRENPRLAKKLKYLVKPVYIDTAMRLIKGARKDNYSEASDFQVECYPCCDQKGNLSYLVTFYFATEKGLSTVQFHVPERRATDYIKSCAMIHKSKKHPVRTRSRANCIYLVNFFGL